MEFWYDDSAVKKGFYFLKLRKLKGVGDNMNSFSDYYRSYSSKSRSGCCKFIHTGPDYNIYLDVLGMDNLNNGSRISIDTGAKISKKIYFIWPSRWESFRQTVYWYNKKHSTKFDNIDLGTLVARKNFMTADLFEKLGEDLSPDPELEDLVEPDWEDVEDEDEDEEEDDETSTSSEHEEEDETTVAPRFNITQFEEHA